MHRSGAAAAAGAAAYVSSSATRTSTGIFRRNGTCRRIVGSAQSLGFVANLQQQHYGSSFARSIHRRRPKLSVAEQQHYSSRRNIHGTASGRSSGIPLHVSSSSSMPSNASSQSTADDNDDISSLEDEINQISAKIIALNDGTYLNPNSPAQVSAAIYGTNNSNKPVPREVLLQLVQCEDTTTTTERQRSMAGLVLQYRELKSRLRRRMVGEEENGTKNDGGSGGDGDGEISSDKASRRDNRQVLSSGHGEIGQQQQQQQQQQLAAFSTSASFDDDSAEQDKEMEDHGNNNNKDDDEPKDVLELQTPPTTVSQPGGSIRTDRSPYGRLVDSLFAPSSSPQPKLDEYWHDALDRVVKPSARAMVAQLDPFLCPMGFDPSASRLGSVTASSSANAGGEPSANTKPTAKAPSTNQGKKGSLLAYVREQKEKFPDCVILTRVGDFYEAFGLDAVLLVEYCGLNPMAGKARAGCPIKNVQPTLDCLTRSGFRVAVYEEATNTDSKAGIKNRFLAQIVSSASPTYLYDLILGNGDTLVTSPAARPHVGIISTASGYTIVEVSSEERTVRVSERATAEAVACKLAAYPPADPLFYVPSPGEEIASPNSMSSGLGRLPFLPSRSDPSSEGIGSRYRVKFLSSAFIEDPSSRMSEIDRARKCIVSALLKISEFSEYEHNDNSNAEPSKRRVTYEDFALVEPSDESSSRSQSRVSTNPLYVETATQLGLMADPTIPPLVSYLLPDSAPAPTWRFLRRWLLTPPPPHVADSMANLVRALKEDGIALPALSVPPLGKVLALVRAGQASAQVYREIRSAMDATVGVLDAYGGSPNEDILASLSTLVQHESGFAADPESVKARCLAAMREIDEVVSIDTGTPQHADPVSDYDDLIPFAFFERNEATWRGRIKLTAAEEAYEKVRDAADKLAEAVAHDFWGIEKYEGNLTDLSLSKEAKSQKAKSQAKSPIVQDIFNNLFAIKTVPSWVDETDKAEYYHPKDRNHKLLRNRYTTEKVKEALHDYVAACKEAEATVTFVLAKLAERLCDNGHLPAVVQASHTNLILSLALHHAASANSLGWNMADITDAESYKDSLVPSHPGHFDNVWPYWMDRSESVGNTFTLDGLFLLTAPNMSGKSTLMRSTAAAALLTNCGLCAPLESGSYVRRFDNIFVRGASADVPTESKSAFGAEMGDVAALIRACGKDSLVFVDELGRGTSPKDGTSLAGAVLEAMAEAGMSGFFATHLHGIFSLPLEPSAGDRIITKRMVFKEDPNATDSYSGLEWTYKMENGTCTESHALVTAARFGLPVEILKRAEALALRLDADTSTANGDVPEKHTVPDAACATKLSGFEGAIQIAEEMANTKAVRIPPRYTPPPSLEGCSCVYVLEVGANPPRYYVGETDSLSKRLLQHRKKGSDWAMLNAAAVNIQGGKSDSRHVESRLIRRLAKGGYDMISIADGRLVRKASSDETQ